MERFLNSDETPLVAAVARRHMVATTRGGAMTAWIDACTFLDGRELRYRVVGEGGAGVVRKRALIAALDGEVKGRREGETGRASLAAANYDFEPGAPEAGQVRVRLRPKRKEAMLIDGAMTLVAETGDLLSVEGRLVKAPSFWTRQVNVIRRYARIGGVRVPVSMASRAQVLVMGASTLDISYTYLSINGVRVENGGSSASAACDAGGAETEAAAAHHERGVGYHLRRSLDEASDEYEAALAADPPREPTRAERRIAERLAPRLLTTRTEPFRLRDVAVVMHPSEPLIAYHLLWDDDIDYPDDNDPSDHEVVWVRYRPDGSLDGFWTYFHGRILDGGPAAMADAAMHGGRPAVLVQWGKHGSMPIGWKSRPIEAAASETEAGFYPVDTPITLERYNRGTYDKLVSVGARASDHPLARRAGWPQRFTGSWDEFSQFPRPVDALTLVRRRGMVLVSRWNSATMNRRLLRYNFKPKTEWPVEAGPSGQ